MKDERRAELRRLAERIDAAQASVKRGHPKYIATLTSADELSLTSGVKELLAECERLKQLAMERYDDCEALHAELGQPYQSATVKGIRSERDRYAAECERLRAVNALLLSAQGELDADTREALTERGHLIGECMLMRPVFEAAKVWRDSDPSIPGAVHRANLALLAAIDSALSSS